MNSIKKYRVFCFSVFVWCCGMGSASAEVDEDGLTAKVFADYIYDSNLFRVSGATESDLQLGTTDPSDNIFNFGLGLGYRLPVSRQLFSVGADVVRHQYDSFDFLDHTSGTALALWDWEFASRLDGKLQFKYVRDILTFEELTDPVLDIRDLYDLSASGKYMLTSRLQLYLAAAHSEQVHSRKEQDFLDRTVNRYIGEIRYTSARKSYVGLRSVVRDAKFPNREISAATKKDNSFTEYEYSVTVNWIESVSSKLWGRLGFTDRRHDDVSDRDFKGATWRFNYDWNPRERFGADLAYWRDLDAYSDQVSSYVEETGASLEAWWEITSKVKLKADVSRRNRDFDGDPNLVNTPTSSRHDRVFGYGAAVDFALQDRVTLSLGYKKQNRESNVDDREYDYYSIFASLVSTF